MDCEDGVIFCQDDFTSKSFSAFEDMRRNEVLVDFKINFGNRAVVGHRLVLAARVPYFCEIFSSSQVEVILEEIDPNTLESLINFAYSGKIKITPGNAASLLSASKYLQLTCVYDACWEFLEGKLDSKNVLEIRRLAEDHRCLKILEAADIYIRQNFEEFTSSESFLVFPFEQLKEVISRDDIKISSEERVFESVITWIKASPSERSNLLPELLSAVRMYFLTPDYLIGTVSAEELVRSSLLCRDLIEEAIKYHLLPDKRSKSSRLPSQPRLCDMKPECSRLSPQPQLLRHLTPNAGIRSLLYSVYRSENETFNVKLFDPEYERWLDFSSHISSEDIDVVALLNGIIYMFTRSSVQTFNVNTSEWKTLDFACNVFGAGSLSYDRIYFFGGVREESSKVRSFSPGQQQMHHECRMPRPLQNPGVALFSSSRAASSSLETFIYLTGGLFKGSIYNTVERYNPETHQWMEVSSMLSKRCGHDCCNVKGKIYVCGGIADTPAPLKSVEVYDPFTNQWNRVSSMRQTRFTLSVASHEDKLFVFGVQDWAAVQDGNMEIYDPNNDEWRNGARISDRKGIGKIFMVK